MPHRYFTTEIADGTATLRGADAHHLARVMRAKPGDTVILCDGNAVEYTATITGFGEDRVDFAVEPGYPSAAEATRLRRNSSAVFCLKTNSILYTSPSPRDHTRSRMPSSA